MKNLAFIFILISFNLLAQKPVEISLTKKYAAEKLVKDYCSATVDATKGKNESVFWFNKNIEDFSNDCWDDIKSGDLVSFNRYMLILSEEKPDIKYNYFPTHKDFLYYAGKLKRRDKIIPTTYIAVPLIKTLNGKQVKGYLFIRQSNMKIVDYHNNLPDWADIYDDSGNIYKNKVTSQKINNDASQIVKKQSILVNGQIHLTPEEKDFFKERTLQKVRDFQHQLSIIANKEKSTAFKQIATESALNLFINGGKEVNVQVSSSNRGKKKLIELPEYLKRLANLPHSNIIVKSVKSLVVGNWFKKGTDEFGYPIYEATATYYQEFIGYNGSFENQKVVYRDITQKTVTVEIRYQSSSHAIDGKGKWIVLLGDINVEETTKL